MEQQYMQYLMWHKNKHLMFRNSINNNNNSWEEQAFAEDAANPLGGFIWPPRSYTCSFCRREFRSAQALGGHMNVHRRDRARLKQSNSSSSSLSPQLEPDHQPDSGSPYSSLSSASAAILSPQNSSTTTLNPRNYGNPSSPNGSDNSNSGKFLSLWNQKFKRGHDKDTVDTKLSVGLGYEIEESNNNNNNNSNSKKRRFMGKDIASFSSSSRNGNVFQKVVLGSKPSNSIDESIDLELKL